MDESCNGPDRYREMTFVRTNVDIRVMLAYERVRELKKTRLPSYDKIDGYSKRKYRHTRYGFALKVEKSQRGKRTTFSREEMKVRRASGRCSGVLRILG